MFLVGIQELFGHKDVKTTMVYTHVQNQGLECVRSSMDEVSLVSYTDQHKTLPVQRNNT